MVVRLLWANKNFPDVRKHGVISKELLRQTALQFAVTCSSVWCEWNMGRSHLGVGGIAGVFLLPLLLDGVTRRGGTILLAVLGSTQYRPGSVSGVGPSRFLLLLLTESI